MRPSAQEALTQIRKRAHVHQHTQTHVQRVHKHHMTHTRTCACTDMRTRACKDTRMHRHAHAQAHVELWAAPAFTGLQSEHLTDALPQGLLLVPTLLPGEAGSSQGRPFQWRQGTWEPAWAARQKEALGGAGAAASAVVWVCAHLRWPGFP